MNPLTPGPPPPIPGHHQHYHQNYYQPPPAAAPPAHHGQPNATQPCFNCGSTTHWAQQCPEPRRHMLTSTAQQKPRNRGPKSGSGPIITRYPPPQPQFYPNHPYPTTPQAQIPGMPHYQQPYGQPYGAPPPPPQPHPMPPQPGPSQHYGAPPPPPPYPPYTGPHNSQYPHAPPYSPVGFTPGAPPPVPPPHHQQVPFYSPPSQNGASQAYRTPITPVAPYQFHNQPPIASQPFSLPPQRKGNNPGRHRQQSISQPHTPVQQRISVSEPSSASTKGIGPIIWRPAQRVETPLATTLQETEEREEQGLTGFENPNGTISKYWNPGGKRTRAHPRLSDLMKTDDPALKSIRGGCRVIERDFLETNDSPDAGRDDVAMELENSDDGKPDVLNKLSGVLSRQSSEPGSEFRAPADGEYSRRKSWKYEEHRNSRDEGRRNSRDEERRVSRDAGAQSPRRGRSKSPADEDSTYSSYRSRTPSGGASIKKNRTQHPLPAKPDSTIDTSMNSPPKPAEQFTLPSTDNSPINVKQEQRTRYRSASPTRKDSEDDNRRQRDYNMAVKTEDSDRGKTPKDSKKRRTSGTNGVPALFGRRW